MTAGERRARRRFCKAYADAWATRQRTGDGSDVVLTDALARHDVHLSFAHEQFLEIWRRGVPPHAVPAAALDAGVVLAPRIIEAFLDMADALEGPLPVQLRDLPQGRHRLTEEPHWTIQRLLVVYDKAATAYLGSLPLPVANTRTGELAAQVWLLTEEEPLADVMLGEARLGTVRLTPTTWKLLEQAEEDNTFADGIVYCWPAGTGVVEPDALLVALPL
ncbi:MAG TPA: hypothetical protein VFK41_01500 [Nocardioidaceae bacterium]|nr:hypothetical protein [Nocardioidaceae bacterium]